MNNNTIHLFQLGDDLVICLLYDHIDLSVNNDPEPTQVPSYIFDLVMSSSSIKTLRLEFCDVLIDNEDKFVGLSFDPEDIDKVPFFRKCSN